MREEKRGLGKFVYIKLISLTVLLSKIHFLIWYKIPILQKLVDTRILLMRIQEITVYAGI